MWPILILGVLALGVIIERHIAASRCSPPIAMNSAARCSTSLQADRIEEATEKCNEAQGPVAAILGAGIRKLLVLKSSTTTRQNRRAGRQSHGRLRRARHRRALERHLPVLATVSSVALMLGFLGTVQGMVIVPGHRRQPQQDEHRRSGGWGHHDRLAHYGARPGEIASRPSRPSTTTPASSTASCSKLKPPPRNSSKPSRCRPSSTKSLPKHPSRQAPVT